MPHIPIIILLIMLAGCTGRHDGNTVPRRTAYPRPTLPDTAMTAADTGAAELHLEVNAAAETESPRPGWINVTYPGLGARIHITVTPVTAADVADVRANRMQRLTLNEGDRRSEHREWANAAGFDILVARTEASSTPLQFLATDDSSAVVSGAVHFADPAVATTESADSIRPILDALERDIVTSLSRLRHDHN